MFVALYTEDCERVMGFYTMLPSEAIFMVERLFNLIGAPHLLRLRALSGYRKLDTLLLVQTTFKE